VEEREGCQGKETLGCGVSKTWALSLAGEISSGQDATFHICTMLIICPAGSRRLNWLIYGRHYINAMLASLENKERLKIT